MRRPVALAVRNRLPQRGRHSREQDTDKQYSVWDIRDEKQNYFGTITLESDNTTVRMPRDFYQPPVNETNLNYLADFLLEQGGNSCSLSVARVYADLHPSFPDAPLAEPATRGAKGAWAQTRIQ